MTMDALTDKVERLRHLVADMQSALIAFSGGIDSTLVLKIAHDELGARAVGVTAVSPTYPAAELDAATRTAQEIGAEHAIVQTDQLTIPAFVQNDGARCFHCKTDLYQLMERLRIARSMQWVLDGTNLDDLGDDRPGIKAAREWNVRSPLVEAALTKADVRAAAHQLGLSSWDKPAAACLSSRIPRGIPITMEKLRRVEAGRSRLAGRRIQPLSGQGPWRHCSNRNGARGVRTTQSARPTLNSQYPPARDRLSLRLCGFGRISTRRDQLGLAPRRWSHHFLPLGNARRRIFVSA